MSTLPTKPAAKQERDPVCGMNVNPATAEHISQYDGDNYYFCCAACAHKFKAEPQKYLSQKSLEPSGLVTLGSGPQLASPRPEPEQSGKVSFVCPMCPEVRESRAGACPSCGMSLEPEIPSVSARTEYTCPMHPEIVRPGPGSCPICGMALEPRTVSAAPEENPELRDMTRRFWVSLALTAPLMAIAMSSMLGYKLRIDLDI